MNMLERRLANALLLLRWSIFVVMLVWTIDKFVQPEHGMRVFENFYFLTVSENLMMILGGLELLLLLAFVLGIAKTFSYGLVLLMHTVSTLSSWQQYLDPFNNLLFFAAWPMLAACVALFMLRDYDYLLTIGGKPPRTL